MRILPLFKINHNSLKLKYQSASIGKWTLTVFQSVDDIHKQMTLPLNSNHLREELRCKGREHSSKCSWQKCAKQTYDIYRSLVD